MTQKIHHGSSSRLHAYEACPRKAMLTYVAKIAQPEDPNSPLLRGTRIHTEIEDYVRGSTQDAPQSAGEFIPLFDKLREEFPTGRVLVEENWMFDPAWLPVPTYDDIWFIAKLDYMRLDPTDPHQAYIYDVKTGKKEHSIVKHLDQLTSYAICAFLKYEELDRIGCADVYVDIGETLEKTFTRPQAMKHMASLQDRLVKMTDDTVFHAKPSKWTCGYCPYKTGTIGRNGPEGTGDCDLNPV